MTRAAMLTVGAVSAGFMIGFLWGKGSRSQVNSNVRTDVTDGVVTVAFDAKRTLLEGAAVYFK